MKYDFSGKVIIITGGTGALGKFLTRCFLDYNSKTVVVTYRSDKEMHELKTGIDNISKQQLKISTTVEFVKADLAKEIETKRFISDIIERHGQIHILINVIGSYIGGKSVSQLEESEWDKMINTNLKSAFLISKYIVPVMASKKYGKLVFISSKTGLISNGYDSAYAASKAGLIRFVESVSQEVKEANMNINCILPTILDTESNRKAMPGADFSKWTNLSDLSNVILFLSSDDSKIINGSAIPAYGLL
jgi:NAD(P)-dependent dehydrogenase (short-subunit alcohol dehydrogenase family)